MRTVPLILTMLTFLTATASATTWYVKPDGTGDAPTIQAAIDSAGAWDIVMVAGEDPYAWKGIHDLVRPHVRAAGEGGCGDGRTNLEAYKAQQAQPA